MLLMSSTCCVLATSNWTSAIFFFTGCAAPSTPSARAAGAAQRKVIRQHMAARGATKRKPWRMMNGIGFLTLSEAVLNQYLPAGQHVAFQHEQHGKEQQQERGEAQRLHGESQVAAIARNDVHPAAYDQQQRDQYQEQAQDQHMPAMVASGSGGLQLQPQERRGIFHAVEGDE